LFKPIQKIALDGGLTRSEEVRIEESEESEEEKENNNNNNYGADAPPNGADAPPDGAVVVDPPLVDAVADATGEKTKPKPATYTPAEMPDTDGDAPNDLTPSEKIIELSKRLPKLVQLLTGCKMRPVLSQDFMMEGKAYFERNKPYFYPDVLTICALGIREGIENLPPTSGFDPYFWARQYAHKPNKFFSTAADGDLILAKIQAELKYYPSAEHTWEWCCDTVGEEVKAAKIRMGLPLSS
jgi:hypothetical protein